MKLYPAEIAHKTFDRKMMGYDTEQVSHFLMIVATQMEALLQAHQVLQEEMKKRELHIHELKDKENIMKNAMAHSNQITEKIKSETERECKLIINDAEQKAEMITKDAKESLRKIYQEISDLKKSKMQFEANLKAMAQAHLSLLEQSDNFMPKMKYPYLDME